MLYDLHAIWHALPESGSHVDLERTDSLRAKAKRLRAEACAAQDEAMLHEAVAESSAASLWTPKDISEAICEGDKVMAKRMLRAAQRGSRQFRPSENGYPLALGMRSIPPILHAAIAVQRASQCPTS